MLMPTHAIHEQRTKPACWHQQACCVAARPAGSLGMSAHWVASVCGVLETLCYRGRITLRKNHARWQTALHGFQILAQHLGSGAYVSVNAPQEPYASVSLPQQPYPSVVEHINKLVCVAARICAASTSSKQSSWTYSLQGSWSIDVFQSVVVSIATSLPAAGYAPKPVASLSSGPELHGTQASAAVSGLAVAAASGAGKRKRRVSEECRDPDGVDADAVQQQGHEPRCRPAELARERVFVQVSEHATHASLLVPSIITGADGVPPVLVSLLQLAQLLRAAGSSCHHLRVEKDGSVAVDISRVPTSPEPVAPANQRYRFVGVTQTLRFPYLLSEDSLMPALYWMMSSSVAPETAAPRSKGPHVWHALVAQQLPGVSMWHRFPADVADPNVLRSIDPASLPASCDPRVVSFHPILRWHEVFWTSMSLSAQGNTSRALIQLLSLGAPAVLDLGALLCLASIVLDAGLPVIANGLCHVAMAAADALLPRTPAPARIHLLPLYLTTSLLHHLQLRVVRKLASTSAAALRRAQDLLRLMNPATPSSIHDLATSSRCMLRDLYQRVVAASPGTWRADDLCTYDWVLHAATPFSSLSLVAEEFAQLRLSRASASALFALASRVWAPWTVRFVRAGSGDSADARCSDWRSAGDDHDEHDIAWIPPSHLITSFPAYQYARAIAEASDATSVQINDALVKARHAYRVRSFAFDPDAAITCKARIVMDQLMELSLGKHMMISQIPSSQL